MIDRYDHRGRLLDEPDEFEDDTECPCGAPFGPWQEDRRLVGYPDQFMDTEVRPFRVCPECGEREEGQGWYE